MHERSVAEAYFTSLCFMSHLGTSLILDLEDIET